MASIVDCALCLCELREPKMVPCGNMHTYCRTCLEELSETAVRGSIECPECRQEVKVSILSLNNSAASRICMISFFIQVAKNVKSMLKSDL